MRIGEIAERTGLNISNVRFYERKGLLTPERETGSKYRDYSEEDVNRIKKILLYRKMGIPVDTIYLILKDKQDITDIILRQQKELNEEKKVIYQELQYICSHISITYILRNWPQ